VVKKCLFCSFVSGKKVEHMNGLPFELLNSTRHSVSFLAIDFPANEDGHLLVIPKKHYSKVEDIPANELLDLMKHVQLAVKVTRSKHSGANLLLNDGKVAGQAIFHSHFHIIPRDKDDGIKIEQWKRKKMSKKEFVSLHGSLKKKFERFS